MNEDEQIRLDGLLHRVDIERLEERIVELALELTGARNGGLFVWDEGLGALVINSHVVEGMTVHLPQLTVLPRTDGRPNGIALWVFEQNAPHLCNDTSVDPLYARYFIDVRSIAAVPIPYQHRAIGVLTVSDVHRGAFAAEHLRRLAGLAEVCAKHLRRAQLYRASRGEERRPFLIKGMSPRWLEVERRLEHVSPTDAPVLIHGESGTGKELVAHAIHFNSRRSQAPLVTVNCAAIPETMLESVLFGHKRGAFTGATFDKVGEFQKADGGTLFLDEVGELPVALQAKVLRAVEQGEVQPLGSNDPALRVDVRLLCATNRDLAAMTRDGRFRDDLYYRLSVMTLELPPLRSYKDNLETLAHVFLQQKAHEHDSPVTHISAAAMAHLDAYDFPGNVRELKNAIEHAVILATGDAILPEDLPRSITGARARPPDAGDAARTGTLPELREAWLAPLERRYLTDLLRVCDGNVREAARRAGVNTVTLYRLLKKRGLQVRREIQARSL